MTGEPQSPPADRAAASTVPRPSASCAHHPGVPATANCRVCQKALCVECLLSGPGGVFCSDTCRRAAAYSYGGPGGRIDFGSALKPPPPAHRRVQPYLKWVLLAGLGTLGAAIPGAFVGRGLAVGLVLTGLALLGLWVAAHLALGLYEIPYHLFRRARFRLAELLIILALLGNALGLSISRVVSETKGTGRVWAVAATATLVSVWILSGATWGVWAATMLKREAFWPRLRLILAGILLPVTIIAVPAAGLSSIGVLLSMLAGDVLPKALGAVLLVLVAVGGVKLLVRMDDLQRQAQQEDERQRAAEAGTAIGS